MCGIAGWIIECDAAASNGALHDMSDRLAHRGPDAEGFYQANIGLGTYQLALAHRRLAIIDLDDRANQPMSSADHRLVVIYNGEIYNYLELKKDLEALGHNFKTSSDTEVLINAYLEWGDLAFDRFNGMYAAAIWDNRSSELILVRDPFGKKPLYYFQVEKGLVFSSEIPSLMAGPEARSELDTASVNEYLLMRYVPGPNTLFENAKKLAPGSLLKWRNGQVNFKRFYTPPDGRSSPKKWVLEDAKSELLVHLRRAVELRMRSDAPFGAFLSGGLDSSAVVALMSEQSGQPIRTYAVGFEDERYSELPFARLVATEFGTKHSELVVVPGDIPKYLPSLIKLRGAPLAEPSDVPIYRMAVTASAEVKMVLTGEGSDEVLAGYPKHRAEVLSESYRRLVPQPLHMLITKFIGAVNPDPRLRILARSSGERNFDQRMMYWFGAMSEQERDLLASSLPTVRRELDLHPFSAQQGQSALRRILFYDQTSWLPDNLLERADRMMMAGSIEGRMPFLDKDFVQFVSTLPDDLRLGRKKGKFLLREALRGKLPPEVLTRKKVGFKVPVSNWFRSTLKDYLTEHLCSRDSKLRGYLNVEALDRLVREHMDYTADNASALWSLLGMEIFLREFADTLSETNPHSSELKW